VEPYVISADVYGVPPHVGRGGWTWYTGSASWMYRLGIEALLGLRRSGDRLIISPCIPKSWDGFTMTYRYGATRYDIRVQNPRGVNRGVSEATLDGVPLTDGQVPLRDDGKPHAVHVFLG
jgi:cellobiose phosphorylase